MKKLIKIGLVTVLVGGIIASASIFGLKKSSELDPKFNLCGEYQTSEFILKHSTKEVIKDGKLKFTVYNFDNNRFFKTEKECVNFYTNFPEEASKYIELVK